tara:strand:- start:26109 stop:29111 length:3003 start_codon:yes stop_codon:yes gene_type:complete
MFPCNCGHTIQVSEEDDNSAFTAVPPQASDSLEDDDIPIEHESTVAISIHDVQKPKDFEETNEAVDENEDSSPKPPVDDFVVSSISIDEAAPLEHTLAPKGDAAVQVSDFSFDDEEEGIVHNESTAIGLNPVLLREENPAEAQHVDLDEDDYPSEPVESTAVSRNPLLIMNELEAQGFGTQSAKSTLVTEPPPEALGVKSVDDLPPPEESDTQQFLPEVRQAVIETSSEDEQYQKQRHQLIQHSIQNAAPSQNVASSNVPAQHPAGGSGVPHQPVVVTPTPAHGLAPTTPRPTPAHGLAASAPTPLPRPAPRSSAPAPTPTPAHGLAAQQQLPPQPPPSQRDQKQQSAEEFWAENLESSIEAGPLQTETRAILSLLLLPFLVLGPLALLLGFSARRRIAREPSMFGGKGIAIVGIFLGAIETIALLGLIGVMSVDSGRAYVTSTVRKTLLSMGYREPDVYPSKKASSERLSEALAKELLLLSFEQHNTPIKKENLSLYVYQEPGQRYAYAHWIDLKSKKRTRSLFELSSDQRWVLAQAELDGSYEVRCAINSGATLKTNTAKALIKKFWALRGGFSHVKIIHLYVYQEPKRHQAFAYWKLHKQTPGKRLRSWYVKTLFHYSNDGRWHLSRYGIRTAEDELYSFSMKGSKRLDEAVARRLLNDYYTANSSTFSPQLMYIHQVKSRPHSIVHWQKGRRESIQSLFRRDTSGRWILARPKVGTGGSLQFAANDKAHFSSEVARSLLRRYWRSQRRRLLIRELYIYQPKGRAIAYARWLSHERKVRKKKHVFEGKLYQSVFLRANKGMWFLARPSTKVSYNVRFHGQQGERFSAALAKRLIRRYWREDANERFTGARLKDLYIFQENDPSTAWAHWSLSLGDDDTLFRRTQFFRSNQGQWFLGAYEWSGGVMVKYKRSDGTRLSSQVVRALLMEYLKEKEKSFPKPRVTECYVHQESGARIAYARWVLHTKKQEPKPMHSVFHRSKSGEWHLSLLEARRALSVP